MKILHYFLSLYPNPVYGNSVNIRLDGLQGDNIRIDIINTTGSIVATKNINSFIGDGELTEGTLDVSAFVNDTLEIHLA